MGQTQAAPGVGSRKMAAKAEQTTSTNTEKFRRAFDKLFADMEFRAKRAAMMNYHEAEKCDKKVDQLQMLSTAVGALGVSGIGASIAKTSRVAASKAGMAGMLALPLSGVLQFLATGSSSLAPSVEEKTKLHVRAGAGWQRIAREARSYRVQLKYLPEDDVRSPILSAWYRDLVESSESVSKLLPIKPDTYLKFEHPNSIQDRVNKRQQLLQKYIDNEQDKP